MTVDQVHQDLRAQFGPVRDQGVRPTCLAFAASDAHAGLRSPWAPLSCEYAFYQAQRRASRPPTVGATLAAMLESLRLDGQPEEAGWPYLPSTPALATLWNPPTTVGALFRRASTSTAHVIEAVIGELDLGRAVLILTMLSRSFFTVGKQGIVDPPPTELPEPAQRHAVVAVGHGEAAGQRALLIRNSWGSGWGMDGYAWLTERFLGPRMFAAATLMENIDVPAGPAAA